MKAQLNRCFAVGQFGTGIKVSFDENGSVINKRKSKEVLLQVQKEG